MEEIIMRKISKKGIMGMALLASLSVFAGTTTLKENKNQIPVQNEQWPEPPKDANGNPMKPDETKMKVEFEKREKRIEELKKKLKSGKLTSSEREELVNILDKIGKRRPRRPEGNPPQIENQN